MKNFKSIKLVLASFYYFLIPTAFSAFTNDQEYHQSPVESDNDRASQFKIALYPDNLENPYDIADQLFSEIADKYLKQEFQADSTQTVIDQIPALANSNLQYYPLLPYNYEMPNSSVIDPILAIKNPAQDNIDQASLLSYPAELRLTNFLDTLSVFNGYKTEVEALSTYIFNYESLIIADTTFNRKERDILLTTSSIVRHAFFFAKRKPKKNKDKDWDISWAVCMLPHMAVEIA